MIILIMFYAVQIDSRESLNRTVSSCRVWPLFKVSTPLAWWGLFLVMVLAFSFQIHAQVLFRAYASLPT